MRGDVVVGITCLCMGFYLLLEGISYNKAVESLITSIPLFGLAFFLLYEGIPLELRERRSRAIRKRWEKLDEEKREKLR